MNRLTGRAWGRLYFAVQAVAGAAWWAGVFLVPLVRELTLGRLDPLVVAALDIPLFVVASALGACGWRAASTVATVWTVLVAIALAVYATVSGEAGWGVLVMIAASAGSMAALALVLLGRLPTEWIARGPFRFSPADARARPSAHLARTAAQIVVFWGLFFGLIPAVIVFFETRWQLGVDLPLWTSPAAVVLFVLAGALGLWSAAIMATRGGGTPLPSSMPNRLVVLGPYRVVRNPMAVAGILQAVAVGVLLSSWLVVVYAVAGALVWHHVVKPLEETDLEARFGAEYRRYRAAVRCWWPRLRPVASSRSTAPATSSEQTEPTAPAGPATRR